MSNKLDQTTPAQQAAIRRKLKYQASRLPTVVRDNKRLRKNAEKLRAEVYTEASSATLIHVYDALKDLGLPGAQWLSQRLLAARENRKPAKLDPAVESLVKKEILAHLRLCGQRSYEKEFLRKHGNGETL